MPGIALMFGPGFEQTVFALAMALVLVFLAALIPPASLVLAAIIYLLSYPSMLRSLPGPARRWTFAGFVPFGLFARSMINQAWFIIGLIQTILILLFPLATFLVDLDAPDPSLGGLMQILGTLYLIGVVAHYLYCVTIMAAFGNQMAWRSSLSPDFTEERLTDALRRWNFIGVICFVVEGFVSFFWLMHIRVI